MKRLPYFIAGLILLPACWAALLTVTDLAREIQLDSVGGARNGGWWLLGGFAFWIALFFLLPRPVKTYVLGHELTHAFWGLLMGARVSKLRVSDRGGSVNLSHTNFIITLAPYFFPFYTMLLIAIRGVWSLFADLSPYAPLWLGGVGLTWAFHLTFTIDALSIEQPDIREHGYVFSYTLIVLLNLLGIGLWIVAAAHPTFGGFVHTLWSDLLHAYAQSLHGLSAGFRALASWI